MRRTTNKSPTCGAFSWALQSTLLCCSRPLNRSDDETFLVSRISAKKDRRWETAVVDFRTHSARINQVRWAFTQEVLPAQTSGQLQPLGFWSMSLGPLYILQFTTSPFSTCCSSRVRCSIPGPHVRMKIDHWIQVQRIPRVRRIGARSAEPLNRL